MNAAYRGDLGLSGIALEDLLEASPLGVAVLTQSGVFEFVNPAYCALYQRTANAFLGLNFSDVHQLESHIGSTQAGLVYSTEPLFEGEWTVPLKGGAITVHSRSFEVPGTDGTKKRVLYVTDITHRTRTESRLSAALAKNRAIIQAVPDLIFANKLDGEYLSVEASDPSMLLIPPESFLGKKPHEILPTDLANKFMSAFSKAVLTKELQVFSYDLTVAGSLRHFEARVASSSKDTIVSIVRDISERTRMEAHLQEMAFYDYLTQLPNRRLLQDRLDQALAHARRTRAHGALLFLDLDNFKPLNDAHGHEVGDLLLQQVAMRLKSCVREHDTVARLGGDEFVVVLCDLDPHPGTAADQAYATTKKVLAHLSEPYRLHRDSGPAPLVHLCTASLGAALFSGDTLNSQEALRHADIAMYVAKDCGGNRVQFHELPPV